VRRRWLGSARMPSAGVSPAGTDQPLAPVGYGEIESVAREQEKASPLSGSWHGPADAFNRMEAAVQVVPL